MKNKILIVAVVIFSLTFSCKKENDITSIKSINPTATDSTKTLKLPIDSTILNYKNKDKNDYFIYDKTFTKIAYTHNLARIFGEIPFINNIRLILVEKKPNDGEYTEPIVTLYSFDKKTNQKIDSLNLYETITSEACVTKRFSIDKNWKIHIYENSFGYDFSEDGKEILITDKKHLIYKITNNGQFTLEQDNSTNISNTNLSPPDKSWIGFYTTKPDAINLADNKKFAIRYYRR